ncbi:hypothetical protein V2J09_012345 [Rumex salicifolius]
MSELQKITELISRLALQLHTPNSSPAFEERSIDLSISDLNGKLNPNTEASSSSSRVRVLDTVLSLMCFKAPQVFDLRVEYLVKTIVSVLSSSVDCKSLTVQNRQILLVGSSISRFDCFKLLETLDDLIGQLKERRILSFNLLQASIRSVALASNFQNTLTSIPTVNLKPLTGLKPVVSRLIRYIPDEILLGDEGIQLRLMIWYLDPLLLKRNVSKVLQEVKERPFLSLSDEFRQKNDWKSLVKCLVLCPVMFIETRNLLHSWFLLTGSLFVLKLQTHFLATLLDVISRPTCWGMTMDAGSKLPFLHAYFPCNIHLLRVLAGPLSLKSFTSLVQVVEKTIAAQSNINVDKGRKQELTITNAHHHSKGIAITFPNWFLFSTLLLFYDKRSGHNCHPKDLLRIALSKQVLGAEPFSSFSASYIAWILCPVNESEQTYLKDCLVKVSGSLTEQFLSEAIEKQREDRKKKLKKLKKQVKGSIPQFSLGKWLEEFHATFANSNSICYQKCFLIRSIPLGVLLVYSNYINNDECNLLLHYGATGQIVSSWNSPYVVHELKNLDEIDTKEAIVGACFVFDLTEAIENMSATLFDTEEEAQGFIHQIKERTEKYLLICIKTLLKARVMPQMLMDLYSRILQWRCQGEDSPLESQELNEAVTALKEKVPLCL